MESTRIDTLRRDRLRLVRAGTLHWVHWLIIGGSLAITIGAWHLSSSQAEEKVEASFEREAERVPHLVIERLQKYEDALWAGAAMLASHDDRRVTYDQWVAYAAGLNLENKYPGINGIGLVAAGEASDIPSMVAHERDRRPDFRIHPAHDHAESFPIIYIEPVALNAKAVGLDLAHERNRRTAILQARDTGQARVTGPIVLVQDAARTPGFLFYVPIYRTGAVDTVDQRRERFAGLVYAPFMMNELMRGVLAKELRHVGVRVSDGSDVLYDEHVASDADFDPDPLFRRNVEFEMHGRVWTFDIRSRRSFRAASVSYQPLTILLAGLFVDAMLGLLFVLISRANRRALQHADAMTAALEERSGALVASNRELEQFAYVASHDLQEPLRMIASYTGLLAEEYQGNLSEEADEYIQFAVQGAHRMQQLIDDLLEYSRVGRSDEPLETADCHLLTEWAIEDLQLVIEDAKAEVVLHELPTAECAPTLFRQVMQNLVANAVKFRGAAPLRVEISASWTAGRWVFAVRDNGIGMDMAQADRVFEIFQRLHAREDYEGSGIGLALCKRIVSRTGGDIWVESAPGQGATFFFALEAAEVMAVAA